MNIPATPEVRAAILQKARATKAKAPQVADHWAAVLNREWARAARLYATELEAMADELDRAA